MSIPSKQEFLTKITLDLENEKLVLPTFPDVAIQARSAADDVNTTAHQLADIINTDVALSARLLKVANSPLYRARNKIDNIQIAITRMGNRVVRNLIMSITVEQMFNSTSKFLAKKFKASWEHSIQVAALSRALAKTTPHLDPEQAMLAGLFHDIGVLPILMAAEDYPELLIKPAILDDLIDEIHTDVGKLIVEHWDFPDNLTEVVWEHENLQRDPQPKAEYSDLVLIANLQSPSRENHPNTKINWSTIPAFQKLGFDHEVEIIEIEGIKEEIIEVEEIFIT